MEIDIKVLGGLPVTVDFVVEPAEPDVGIMQRYATDWHITAVNGRFPTGGVEWLYRRIDAMPGENDRIQALCDEAAIEPFDSGDEYD